jgi:phosphotransferase system enzyme I (PtsP)
MMRDRFSSEEEQHQTYRQIVGAFAPQQVAMRTLEVGGDKPLLAGGASA